MKTLLRALDGLLIGLIGFMAMVCDAQTTNPPQIAPLPTAVVPPGGYAYPLLDNNGLLIWPTNFWWANSNALNQTSTNLIALATTNFDGRMSSNDFSQLRTPYNFKMAAAWTPPMGLNTWGSASGFSLDENAVTNAALMMLTNGLVGAGYKYFVVDESWSSTTPAGGHDANGLIQLDTNRFSHFTGASLGKWFHDRGMKWGIWLEQGSAGHPDQDEVGGASLSNGVYDATQVMTNWCLDYVKIGGYGNTRDEQVNNQRQWITWMTMFGRPLFVYSMPPYSAYKSYYQNYFGTFRPGALRDSDTALPDSGVIVGGQTADFCNYTNALATWRVQTNYLGYVCPGSFVSLGEIPTFDFAQSTLQTVFSQFAMMQAQLIIYIGINPAPAANSYIWPTATNQQMIAIHQDSLVRAPYMLTNSGAIEVWAKPLANGDTAVWIWNPDTNDQNTASINVNLKTLGATNIFGVKDVWAQADEAPATNSYAVNNLAGRSSKLLRLTPLPKALAPGKYFLSDLAWMGTSTNDNPGFPIQRDKDSAGNPLKLNEQTGAQTWTFAKGLGISADGFVQFYLGGTAESFHAMAGPSSDVLGFSPSTKFVFSGDGVTLLDTGTLNGSVRSTNVNLDVTGVQVLTIQATHTGGSSGATGQRAVLGDAYVQVGNRVRQQVPLASLDLQGWTKIASGATTPDTVDASPAYLDQFNGVTRAFWTMPVYNNRQVAVHRLTIQSTNVNTIAVTNTFYPMCYVDTASVRQQVTAQTAAYSLTNGLNFWYFTNTWPATTDLSRPFLLFAGTTSTNATSYIYLVNWDVWYQ